MARTKEEVVRALKNLANSKERYWVSRGTVSSVIIEGLQELASESLKLIESQPDVVRCKDCKWWETKSEGCRYGYCHACKHGYHSQHWEIEIYRTYPFDWFCADGERKEQTDGR